MANIQYLCHNCESWGDHKTNACKSPKRMGFGESLLWLFLAILAIFAELWEGIAWSLRRLPRWQRNLIAAIGMAIAMIAARIAYLLVLE